MELFCFEGSQLCWDKTSRDGSPTSAKFVTQEKEMKIQDQHLESASDVQTGWATAPLRSSSKRLRKLASWYPVPGKGNTGIQKGFLHSLKVARRDLICKKNQMYYPVFTTEKTLFHQLNNSKLKKLLVANYPIINCEEIKWVSRQLWVSVLN